jgi:hypothetical protein
MQWLALPLLLLLASCEEPPPCAWGIIVSSNISCESGAGSLQPENNKAGGITR